MKKNMKLINAWDLWSDIMMIPHNGDIISSEEVEQAIIDAPAVSAVMIPCKIGDEVWAIRRFSGDHLIPKRGIVSEMYFVDDMRLSITVNRVARGEWGKVVFATEEEARQAIAERKSSNGKEDN